MNYKMNKQDSYWEIEAEKPISIEDCCHDVTTDTFVIAVKHNKDGGYCDREFIDYANSCGIGNCI
ncbi:MAG: hypothetical protein IKK33_16625 [Lachnospiraceae bacterium]|nr:hypothetical protein [Lachnospiraceae bacterium]